MSDRVVNEWVGYKKKTIDGSVIRCNLGAVSVDSTFPFSCSEVDVAANWALESGGDLDGIVFEVALERVAGGVEGHGSRDAIHDVIDVYLTR